MTQFANRLSRMRLVGIDLALADMLQKENPQNMYKALKIIEAHGWQEDDNRKSGAIDNVARNVLQAWDDLALHKEAFDLKSLEWNLALEDGQKLTPRDLPLISRYRSMKEAIQKQSASPVFVKSSQGPKP